MRFGRGSNPDSRGGTDNLTAQEAIYEITEQSVPSVVKNDFGELTLMTQAAGMTKNTGVDHDRTQFLEAEKEVLLISEFGQVGGVATNMFQSLAAESEIGGKNDRKTAGKFEQKKIKVLDEGV